MFSENNQGTSAILVFYLVPFLITLGYYTFYSALVRAFYVLTKKYGHVGVLSVHIGLWILRRGCKSLT